MFLSARNSTLPSLVYPCLYASFFSPSNFEFTFFLSLCQNRSQLPWNCVPLSHLQSHHLMRLTMQLTAASFLAALVACLGHDTRRSPLACSDVGCCSCSCPGACSQECREPEIAPLKARQPCACARPQRTTRTKNNSKAATGVSFCLLSKLS